MANLVETQASQLARALADTDVGSPLVGLKVDLYQTPIAVTPTTPLSVFTAAVATFTGYAQGTVTWSLPSVSMDGIVEVIGSVPIWRPTDAVTPNLIYGAYFTASVGGALMLAGQFDNAPLLMQNALQQIEMTVRYRPATNSIVITIN